MEQRILIVEKFTVHGPGLKLLIQVLADQLALQQIHGFLERKAIFGIISSRNIAQALIFTGILSVHTANDRGEPPLLDRAAFGTVGVEIVRMQAETKSRL